ncbi:MAG: hypothetical protein HQL52_00410 [Magnetococcales bacterium]|nr:hypothetical protein [Magnetococcales bacterium]
MSERDIYSSDQLKKIRETLQSSLGTGSDSALSTLDSRFVASEKSAAQAAEEDKKAAPAAPEVDVPALIQEGNIDAMLEAMGELKDNPGGLRQLTGALLQHNKSKAFHMVDAMSKVTGDKDLIEALANGVVAKKGINPLIDALRHAVISPVAMKVLAGAIAEQGSVNHIIRSIATAPTGQEEAEIIWAMELIGKAGIDSMLEAINLLEKDSPGVVILATGLVNRKEITAQPLSKALIQCMDHPKPAMILAVELTRLADLPSLVMLMEKGLTDKSEAAEVIIAKMVWRSLNEDTKVKMLSRAAKSIKNDSMAGKILAWGLVQQGDPKEMEKAYRRLRANPDAKNIVGVGLVSKLGKFAALRTLGKEVLALGKVQGAADAASREAKNRYNTITTQMLSLSNTTKPKK